MTNPYEHECFARGCHELVVGRYYCDRHVAIAERQRAAQSRRNSESAAERRESRRMGFYPPSAAPAGQLTLNDAVTPADGGQR